ncbi:MAG: tRNA (N6-threonylcarbamoyladenosine(37)-N6)-methyltransferase TrmO [Clostridia bacterium]|nr:tRNA (N6-threonylcarbamoyladenosine(37)-N6)-methyltransferase TrmO [Clostridia bacterium]
MEIKPIAYIKNRFSEKFGIPRQPLKVNNFSEIVFEKEYAKLDAVRGLEGFSHIWLIFDFSMSHREKPSLTVRPPRLGGNKRIGVFASRSPFRPNSIGLSAVKLCKIKAENGKLSLIVEGADLLNGTPIYDIKPYIPYADSIKDATSGFTSENADYLLEVTFDEGIKGISEDYKTEIEQIIKEDPRPQYKEDNENIYKMRYGKYDVSFTVMKKTARVVKIDEYKEKI